MPAPLPYSAAMLALLQQQSPLLFPLFKLELPNADYLYSKPGIASLTLGQFRPLVRRFGELHRVASDRDDQLQAIEYSIEIIDDNRELDTLIARGIAIKGSIGTLYLAAPQDVLTYADWATFFIGGLESWTRVATHVYRLSFRNNDNGLRRMMPLRLVSPSDFPDADPDVYGKVIPIVLGKHSSIGVGNNGMLPALYVDTSGGSLAGVTGYKYLCGLGRIPVDVFVDGTSTTAGFTTNYLWINGSLYTILAFTVDQGDAEVTFDAKELQDSETQAAISDLAPALITVFCANWIFSEREYKGGPIATAPTAEMDADSWNNLELASRSALYISEQQTGEDLVSSWGKTFNAKIWYTHDNKLKVAIDSLDPATDHYTLTWLKYDSDLLAIVSIDWPEDGVVEAYSVDEYSGGRIEIVDPLSPATGKIEVLERAWAPNWIARGASHGLPTPTGQWEADTIPGNDGDPVTTWAGLSGSRDWTGSGGIFAPVVKRNILNGHSVLQFDGVNDQMTAAGTLASYITNNLYTLALVFRPISVSTTAATMSNNDAVFCDANSRMGLYLKSAAGNFTLHGMNADAGGEDSVTLTPPDGAASTPVNDDFVIAYMMHSAGTLFVSWDEYRGELMQSIASGNTTSLTGQFFLGRNGAASQFSNIQIAALYIWNTALTREQRGRMHNYLFDAKYFRPTALLGKACLPHDDARAVGSRRLRGNREPRMTVTVQARMHTLNSDLMTPVAVSHPDIPDARGAGPTSQVWGRRPFRIMEQVIDFDALTAKLVLADLRRYAHLYSEGNTAGEILDTAYGGPRSGQMIAAPEHHVRQFIRHDRESVGVMNASGRVQMLGRCAEKIGYRKVSATETERLGLLIESAILNYVERSSSVSGETGAAETGTGVNGSNVTLSTAEPLLFESASPNSRKFLAGSPHAADLYVDYGIGISITNGSALRLSVDYRCQSGAPLYYALFRNVDSAYWNATTQLWVVGPKIWNVLGSSTFIDRAMIKATSITSSLYGVQIGYPSGITAGSTAHVYHVQLERADCFHSRVVTDGTAGLTAADQLDISSYTGGKLWIEEVGTGALTFEPLWSTSDLSTNKGLLELYNGAGQSFELYYDYANTRLCFREAGSSAQEARVTATLTRGTQYRIVWRWLSAEGEYGNTARTLSIWLDGVKGTDAVGSLLTASALATLRVGRVAASVTADAADGYFNAGPEILRQALSDEEAANW